MDRHRTHRSVFRGTPVATNLPRNDRSDGKAHYENPCRQGFFRAGEGNRPLTCGLRICFDHLSPPGAANGFRPIPLWRKAFKPSLVASVSHRFSPFRALSAPSARPQFRTRLRLPREASRRYSRTATTPETIACGGCRDLHPSVSPFPYRRIEIVTRKPGPRVRQSSQASSDSQ